MSLHSVPETIYRSTEVMRLAGITYRQLDYWTRAGIVSPSVPSMGPGSQRSWSESDLARVRAIAEWVRIGVTPTKAALLVEQGAEVVIRPPVGVSA